MIQRRLLPFLCAALLALNACNGSSSSGSASSAAVSLLYLQETTGGGSLEPVEGEEGTFTLTLTGVSATMYVADRPNRLTGSLTTEDFVSEWEANGFVDDPPNAILEVDNVAGLPTSMAVELSDPQYDADAQAVTYQAVELEEYPGFYDTPDNDGAIDGDFESASLFIDDGGEDLIRVVFTVQNEGQSGTMEIVIDEDCGLEFSVGSGRSGLEISSEEGGLGISSFALNSNTLVIIFPDSSDEPFSFNLVVYLSGDGEFFEGTASIPSGTNVQADFNNLGEIEISSGDVVAAME